MSWTPPAEGKVWTPKAPAADPEPRSEDSNLKPWERGKVWVPGQKAPEPETGDQEPPPVDPQGGLVKAWSASALDKFDNCPYAIFLQRIKKIPEEEGEALVRGKQVHDAGEAYVKGELGELPEEFKRYKGGMERLRERFAEGKVIAEDNWGFTINWEPCEWMAPNIWGRMKLDAMDFEDETSAKVIDYKTGRKWGNELKHNRQAMIYAVGAFHRYPDLEFITTEFWYVDKNEAPLTNHYTRNKLHIIQPRIEQRAIKLTSCTDFKPKPSREACKWCSYKKNGSCEWAYQE